jgi:PAS domain S-box-containing protein
VKSFVLTFQYRAMRDVDGKISGIYAEGRDVTERAEDEAALEYIRQETHRRWAELESVYENAPVGLALLGAERFEYRRLNRVQSEILDLSPQEVIGKTVRETSPDVAEAAEALFRRVAEGELIRDVELQGELPQRRGEKRSWLVSYAPIYVDGQVDAIICTALETTELRRAERIALQNEKLAAVGRLASSIAHEINNPLEAVTNLLYLARHGDSMEQIAEYLDIAELELRRVSAITTQTLRFHKQASVPRSVSCEDLFSSALGIYQGRLTSARIDVAKRGRAGQPVVCMDGEIRQVLNNLIGNATDALTRYGGRLLLRNREGTNWRTGQQGIWLTVADTGTGMSAETLRRAFEPFFTTKGIGGTGLGLWISREIVVRHQGTLLMRSSQTAGHNGTVVTIFLPFQAVIQPAPGTEAIAA